MPRSSSAATCLMSRRSAKRVLADVAGHAGLPQQSPLLEIAQMVFGDRGIETADVAEAVRTAGR